MIAPDWPGKHPGAIGRDKPLGHSNTHTDRRSDSQPHFAYCSQGKERWFWVVWPSFDAFCMGEQARAHGYAPDQHAAWQVYYLEPIAPDSAAPSSLQLLGLDPSCGELDIRRAYRRKARQSHPDHGGDAESFKQLQRAYEAALHFVGGAP